MDAMDGVVRRAALARLRERVAAIERRSRDAVPGSASGAGIAPLWGTLAPAWGVLNEARADDWRDGPAAAGFALALAARRLKDRPGPLILIETPAARADGAVSARGLLALGLDPAAAIFVRPRTGADALIAAERAAATADAAVVILARGRLAKDGLAATRRIALAAAGAGATPVLVQTGEDAASAAPVRFRVAAAPSAPHPFNPRSPGAPTFRVTVLRGPSMSPTVHLVEWRRDEQHFAACGPAPEPAQDFAADSRALFSPSRGRSPSPAHAGPYQRAARAL